MTKKKKKGKVEVQKGPIEGDVRTMKSMYPQERTLQDSFEGVKRNSMQHPKKVSRGGY